MKFIFLNRYFYPDHSATSQMLSDLGFCWGWIICMESCADFAAVFNNMAPVYGSVVGSFYGASYWLLAATRSYPEDHWIADFGLALPVVRC